ncbi:rRNA cytosine-C5-methylase [Desertihabitans brevis]|uniref:rRNA cytosine-C5-methylase n=1 Tax=Desertihabitans brevis TaxID=2268447 RepID=A0A367Z1S0_9ACTN|nr:RsmB/NOP family class I SAM-dependent RNA methyltransferase [Desertihabitans brevis]RCK71171.1 rRNA cytosine-C5-methylase [Desertihabitans brevis]
MSPARGRTRRRPRVDQARRVAYDALRAVHASDAYANLVLSDLLAQRRLTGRDAAFATELLHGTCRGEGSYDRVVAAASGRAVTDLQPAVLDVLRLGTHQLLRMDVPDHAAVATSVDLARSAVGERVAGLVNAVLRRVGERSWEQWVDHLGAALPAPERLALATAHPRWVVDAFTDLLGDEAADALAADNVTPMTTLVRRPGLVEPDELRAAGAEPTGLSPFGWRVSGNPGDLAAVREGRAGVQDEGSQLVALALARAEAPEGPWLDLCAGPGGKTALLAALAGPGTRVVAAERQPHRAQLVRQAVRARSEPPLVVTADGTRPPWRAGSFAKVLADVPCTGLGALRRRPEARWRRRPEDVPELHPLQLRLLTAALDSTRPGGVTAYVTCSPHRTETVEVVQEVLAGRDDVEVVPAAPLLPEVSDAALGDFVQLWPHRHGTDAMFLALLRRTG